MSSLPALHMYLYFISLQMLLVWLHRMLAGCWGSQTQEVLWWESHATY